MWTSVVCAAALLAFVPGTTLSNEPVFRVTGPDPGACECLKGPGDDFQALLPCAWKQAQFDVAQHYPVERDRVYKLEKSPVAFRKGHWYDPRFKSFIVGDTDLRRDPPVMIGLTGKVAYDYETAVHEYKHVIIDRLRLGERAHAWVDSEDSN